MAIDSAGKRASVLSFGVIALSLVIPSGTVDQQAKQTVVNLYSGILAIAPIATEDSTFAVFGLIQERGLSVASSINTDGVSVLVDMSGTFSTFASIQETGQGVTGTINENGQGVKGDI